MSNAIRGAAIHGATMLEAEFRRTLRMARSYWLEYAADLLLYIVGFLLLIAVFSAASTSYGPRGYLSTLIGYTVWKICASAMADIARIASEEARTGTLEQLFVSSVSSGMVFVVRSLGILLNRTVRGLLMAFILAIILGITQPIPPLAVVVFATTVAGACGLGYTLVGLVLVYKRVGGAIELLWQMLVFFTGALAPIQNPLLGAFSKLLPLTLGIDCLRAIIIDSATATELWQSGLIPGLLFVNAFYLILGGGVFDWGQRRARQLGVLAHY